MNKPYQRRFRRDQEEFAFDLTPDLTDGESTISHDHVLLPPKGSDRVNSRADDQPHLGRKGGAF